MRLQLAETPLFLSENSLLVGHNTVSKEEFHRKERVLETCFEGAGTPAIYLGNSSMLSAFSMGRTTALVIDVGAMGTRISPIVDGYELKRSSIFTQRGGNVIDALLKEDIQSRIGGTVRPWYESSKYSGTKVPVTQSFRDFHVGEVVQDVKQWMCFVPHVPIVRPPEVVDPVVISRLREEELQRRGLQFPPPYELPDGTLVYSGDTICTAPERVFFPSAGSADLPFSPQGIVSTAAVGTQARKRTRDLLDSAFPATALEGSSSSDGASGSSAAAADCGAMGQETLMQRLGNRVEMESLSDLVYACVAHADPDVRKELLANIQIVGGGSLIQGLSNRVSYELGAIVPSHMKAKLVTSLPVERHHAAWIGGSILGICGSFQQLWLTRQEYDELGATRAVLRFDR